MPLDMLFFLLAPTEGMQDAQDDRRPRASIVSTTTLERASAESETCCARVPRQASRQPSQVGLLARPDDRPS